MKRLVVGAASLNQTPLDWSGNLRRAREAVSEARDRGVDVLCLPELALTGYGCEDLFLAPDVGRRALASLEAFATECGGLVAAVGLPLWHESSVFNAVALISDGEILGFAAKQNLAGDGLHYEPRWFKPWPVGVVERVRCGEGSLPCGDLVFELGDLRLGFEICEDAWVADRPGTRLARRGVDLILNPSASHFAFGKQRVRERFVLEGSRAFACAYVYANLLGNEAGRVIYDGGTLVACGGEILAEGPRFSFREHLVTSAVVDLDIARLHQARQVSHRPLMGEAESLTLRAPFPGEGVPGASSRRALRAGLAPPQDPAATRAPMAKEEEFARAVSLGLFDYLRKSRSGGFVVSLSGGADSAAVSVLAKTMLDLAVEELGEDVLRERLGYLRLGEGPLAAQLLSCVYQSTRNSSETTRAAAEAVARAVGADYQEWDVDALVEGYRATVEAGLGRSLDWGRDDLALQNIQARTRAPGIWMLANLRNALLLSTSNRSEAAVGYATMDGDTSGGLCPVSGIDKAFLREWLRWMETCGCPPSIRPLPELRAVNEQAPTAELRPAGADGEAQTDESDLMPYPILDAIERLAIRDKKLPFEVWERLCESLPGESPERLREWVAKFFRLWSRNQWKRERYAPGFHLDDENLDPKTWCRFPILSGGFADELKELEAFVAHELP